MSGTKEREDWLVGYRNKTYVIFDGDNDKWAYGFMKGWRSNENVAFDFNDAHDVAPLTANAQSEMYVKRALRQRFASAKQVVLLVGNATKNLYRYVRWELDVALELDLPIVVVNLVDTDLRKRDDVYCPPIVRDTYSVHVPFKAAIIQHALGQFPDEYRRRDKNAKGPRVYGDHIYSKLGL